MNKKEFLQSLNCRKIDITKSVNFMQEFGLADRYGTKHKLTSPEEFLTELKDMGCDVEGVYYKEPDWLIGEITDSVESVIEDTPEASEEDIEPIIEETDTIVPDEVEIVSETVTEAPITSEDSNTTHVDWEWVNSLKSTRDDKKRLDKYAQDNFNINLNQGQKISKMIEEFKSALEEK